MKKEFNRKPLYNKNFLKIKIISYSDEATDSHDKEIPRVGSNYIYLPVTLIGFVFKKHGNYFW